VGDGDGVLDGAAGEGDLTEVGGGAGDRGLGVDVEGVEEGVAAAVFDEGDGVVAEPGDEGGGSVDRGGDVGGLALAVGSDDPDVAAGGTLVGHQAADEGDALAVRGPARDGDLEAVQGGVGGGGVEDDLWFQAKLSADPRVGC